MGFVDRNDDVFALSGVQAAGGTVSLRETKEIDAHPILMECCYTPKGASTAFITLTWNPLSPVRHRRGDRVDFNLTLQRHGKPCDGDMLSLRFPLTPDRVIDPIFAAVCAAAFKTSQPADLPGAELGFAEQGHLRFALPFARTGIQHMAGAWHFKNRNADPALELRFHLRKSQNVIALHTGRLFAGHDYDPYVFNPAMEQLAFFNGQPDFPGASEVIAEFEMKAIESAKAHTDLGMQSFIRPFMVMREGTPRFPMLIGTPNSISCYAIEPKHDCKIYADNGYVENNDVVLGCGAHAGQMATVFALVAGNKGSVVAFDPFPQNCRQIEAQAQLNKLDNLVAVMSGVGSAPAIVSASINGQQTLNSSAANNDLLDVSIIPLDDYIGLKPTFIKVDVEGADVAAMLGAQKLIQECRPKIFVELHTQFIGQFGHTLADFFTAIPLDLYNVSCKVEGIDRAWRSYEPGLEAGVTQPMLVWATPR
jgi:FkbM family methyltransferase